jgi:hypothetical protein
MERHLSTGVATIVALMAAHRAESGNQAAPGTFIEQLVRIKRRPYPNVSALRTAAGPTASLMTDRPVQPREDLGGSSSLPPRPDCPMRKSQ